MPGQRPWRHERTHSRRTRGQAARAQPGRPHARRGLRGPGALLRNPPRLLPGRVRRPHADRRRRHPRLPGGRDRDPGRGQGGLDRRRDPAREPRPPLAVDRPRAARAGGRRAALPGHALATRDAAWILLLLVGGAILFLARRSSSGAGAAPSARERRGGDDGRRRTCGESGKDRQARRPDDPDRARESLRSLPGDRCDLRRDLSDAPQPRRRPQVVHADQRRRRSRRPTGSASASSTST